MADKMRLPGQIVFGLDIGTRSIVGTVGYRKDDRFCVAAQCIREHKTRAMLDGQIHDIRKVGETIIEVKNELEEIIGRELKEVCIAAAGRVLRTINSSATMDFTDGDKEITQEDIYALDSLGIENAYRDFLANNNETDINFYCVGYSVIRYYMNGYPISNLEGHKARQIGSDMIATFLPDDVVDGLYKAVAIANLDVVNLTLEPIAAIQVAIPEMYRMLNIALVDVGAGTSDISITRDGSIIAYGMIPIAGDALTEAVAKHCLVDFATAETIKREAGNAAEIEYKDIMGITQKISSKEIIKIAEPVCKDMTKQVAEKIKELNGDKSVSAVFVVGGGGMLPGYTDMLAKFLDIPKERVAVRGEEVMQGIDFDSTDAIRNALMVTPIGICECYYEQSNNFIYVYFNEERVKLYDNNKLAVVDAAMQAGFGNEDLFPKRGKEINYTVNGKAKISRGEVGEPAVIKVNGKDGDLYTPIHSNDHITVTPSTAGEPAHIDINKLPEYGASIFVEVNDKKIDLPRFASVNGNLQSGYYEVQDGDAIEFLNYYTVRQLTEFMDVILDPLMNIYVNNKLADYDTKVYENFSVVWTLETLTFDGDYSSEYEDYDSYEKEVEQPEDEAVATDDESAQKESGKDTGAQEPDKLSVEISVMVNDSPVLLTGKSSYVYVDVFDHIDFDLSKPQGRGIVTKLNGSEAQYMEEIHNGDVIDIYWKQ